MNSSAWRSAILADLLEEAIGGLWGSSPDSANPDETDVLVVRGADFRNWSVRRAADAAPRRVPIRSLERRRLDCGDLVLEVSGGGPGQPVGRVLVIDQKAVAESPVPLICSNFCRKLRLKPGVDPFFVKRQLDWLYRSGHTDRFQTATTNIRNLKVDDFVRGTEVVLPDERLQARLTALLDSIDHKRASGVMHVVTARRAIERFRQAVLAAAYAEAGSAEHNAEGTRLEAILSEPFKNGYSARPVNHETPYRVLTLTATTSGWFNAKHFKFTDEEFPPESPFWLSPGDIMVQRGNTAEYVGVPALYDGPPGEYLYPDLMIRARIRSEIDPRFVWYMLLAPQARTFLRDRATGSAGNMPKINQKVLAGVPVPIPDRDIRDEIVKKLDVAFKLADAVEQRIQVIGDRVDRSSQAVLAKAFRGDLVTNALGEG